MASTSPNRRKKQKGAAILETSLVFMTLLSMIIFVIEMGRILLLQQWITERARVTVRTAVVNSWYNCTSDQTPVQNFLVYNNTTAPSGGGPGYLGLLPSQVSCSLLGTQGYPDYRLQVKVTGVPVLTWIPFVSGQYTLPSIAATMPAESLGATN